MTAAIAAAVSAALPTGIISLWSGAANAIPSGWLLCNGSSGTPDLRNRFIVGAGDTYAVGDTGGSATVTLTSGEIPAHAHSINVNSGTESDFHQHTININTGGQSQSHTHDYTVVDADGVGSNTSGFVTGTSGTNTTGNASQDHIHNVSGTSANQNTAHFHNVSGNTANAGGGGAHENRPPYYALCYIMKA
jgi:microcystin-dependent protein